MIKLISNILKKIFVQIFNLKFQKEISKLVKNYKMNLFLSRQREGRPRSLL